MYQLLIICGLLLNNFKFLYASDFPCTKNVMSRAESDIEYPQDPHDDILLNEYLISNFFIYSREDMEGLYNNINAWGQRHKDPVSMKLETKKYHDMSNIFIRRSDKDPDSYVLSFFASNKGKRVHIYFDRTTSLASLACLFRISSDNFVLLLKDYLVRVRLYLGALRIREEELRQEEERKARRGDINSSYYENLFYDNKQYSDNIFVLINTYSLNQIASTPVINIAEIFTPLDQEGWVYFKNQIASYHNLANIDSISFFPITEYNVIVGYALYIYFTDGEQTIYKHRGTGDLNGLAVYLAGRYSVNKDIFSHLFSSHINALSINK